MAEWGRSLVQLTWKLREFCERSWCKSITQWYRYLLIWCYCKPNSKCVLVKCRKCGLELKSMRISRSNCRSNFRSNCWSNCRRNFRSNCRSNYWSNRRSNYRSSCRSNYRSNCRRNFGNNCRRNFRNNGRSTIRKLGRWKSSFRLEYELYRSNPKYQ